MKGVGTARRQVRSDAQSENMKGVGLNSTHNPPSGVRRRGWSWQATPCSSVGVTLLVTRRATLDMGKVDASEGATGSVEHLYKVQREQAKGAFIR